MDARTLSFFLFFADLSLFSVYAQRDVSAGEPLLLCYGPHDDATLVQSYGFVLPHNPHTRSNVPPGTRLTHLEEGGASSPDGIEALESEDAEAAWRGEHGFDDSTWAFEPTGPSWSLLGALRLAHCTPTEREGGAAFAILEGEPVSAQCEVRAWKAARVLAEAQLKQFVEIVPELDDAPAIERLALQYRMAQVEVLEESLRSMDMTLEALVQSASEGKKRRRR